jgi:hypothetical protein
MTLALLAAPAAAGELDALAWLEGSWERETKSGLVVESWRPVSTRTMEGSVRRIGPDGESRETESILIAQMGGELFYIPRPGGNPLPVAFKRVESSATRVVFENRDHDFPQRIGYERQEDGSLLAWIEGEDAAGERQHVEFPYKRVAE